MKKLWKKFDTSIISFAIAGICIIATFFLNVWLALIEVVLVTILFVIKLQYEKRVKEKLLYQVETVADELDFERGEAF